MPFNKCVSRIMPVELKNKVFCSERKRVSERWEVDHRSPIQYKGQDPADNLRVMDWRDNRKKGSKNDDE